MVSHLKSDRNVKMQLQFFRICSSTLSQSAMSENYSFVSKEERKESQRASLQGRTIGFVAGEEEPEQFTEKFVVKKEKPVEYDILQDSFGSLQSKSKCI